MLHKNKQLINMIQYKCNKWNLMKYWCSFVGNLERIIGGINFGVLFLVDYRSTKYFNGFEYLTCSECAANYKTFEKIITYCFQTELMYKILMFLVSHLWHNNFILMCLIFHLRYNSYEK